MSDLYRDPTHGPNGERLELRDALDAHAEQVYEATRALHATVGGSDLWPWARLDYREKRQFLHDITDAMTDVHAATLEVGRRR